MKLTTSNQIKQNMRDQGRSYTWLMKELSISRRTFYIRLNDNIWQMKDLQKMQNLGIL